MKKNWKHLSTALALLLALCLSLNGCLITLVDPADTATAETKEQVTTGKITETVTSEDSTSQAPSVIAPNGFDLSSIPAYQDQAYVNVNGGTPYFEERELVTSSYETYGALDSLGRCTVTVACVGKDLMPTEDRESISSVKPTGWHSVSYGVVNGDSLYNRCHLIAFQLTGENANHENLVTGTSYMNKAMIPFENMVADYVKETGNHVMYRATPIFEGQNLVCAGILLEAYSVEDEGEGICFNVFLYNVQPGVEIDYATGESRLAEGETSADIPANATYIINKKSKKYHRLDSKYAGNLTANMEYTTLSKAQLEAQGYDPCGTCKP